MDNVLVVQVLHDLDNVVEDDQGLPLSKLLLPVQPVIAFRLVSSREFVKSFFLGGGRLIFFYGFPRFFVVFFIFQPFFSLRLFNIKRCLKT